MVLKKSRKKFSKGYTWIFLFLMLILADRFSKLWAVTHSKDFGIVAINYAYNTGAGFSILTDYNALLLWIAVIALGLIIYFNKYFPPVARLLLISGIIGNLIDRIFLGHVIDFIDLKWFPIFNFSDSYITIGVIITAIYWFTTDLKKVKKVVKSRTSNKKLSKKKK